MQGLRRLVYGATGIVVFFGAVQLMAAGAGLLSAGRQALITGAVQSPVSALGGGWLLSYLFLSGSPSAALFLALFDAGLVSLTQLFLGLAGSRIGASLIVVLIGLAGYLAGSSDDVMESLSMGVLTFIVAFMTYIPAIVVGAAVLRLDGFGVLPATALPVVPGGSLAGQVAGGLGAVPSIAVAIVLMLASFRIFDRAFSGITVEQFRSRRFRFLFGSRWMSFAVGAVVTLVTTSVSVSLGIVVPLYYRGLVRREDVVPYMLGANITTLMDTLLAALVLESAGAVTGVVVLALSASLVTLGLLLWYDRFFAVVKYSFDRAMRDITRTVAVLVVLGLLPLVLLLV